MKIATIVVRSLLGLMFVFAGSNHFLNFAPLPPFPEGPAQPTRREKPMVDARSQASAAANS